MDKGIEFEKVLDIDKATVIRCNEYRGEMKLDVRHHWPELGKPTKKGINIPLEDAPELIMGLIEAYTNMTGLDPLESLY